MWITKRKLKQTIRYNIHLFQSIQMAIEEAKPNGVCKFNCPMFMESMLDYGVASGVALSRSISLEADGSLSVRVSYCSETKKEK